MTGRPAAWLHDQDSPFHYFKMSPEIIRLAVTLSFRFPLPLRDVEDFPRKRGVGISL
jgi:putative transposase